jgi:hypothetical protein
MRGLTLQLEFQSPRRTTLILLAQLSGSAFVAPSAANGDELSTDETVFGQTDLHGAPI